MDNKRSFILSSCIGDLLIVENTDNKSGVGVKVFSTIGKPLYAFPNIHWWNKDGLWSAIRKHKDRILERMIEK